MSTPSHKRLGNSGLVVSTIGIGLNNLGRSGTATEDLAGTQAVIDAALDAGITLFDTADIYGKTPGLSEELLGKALGNRRREIVLATKFGMDMRGTNGPDFGARGSRRYIVTAVEASLRRLNTDYIDLLQLHTPDSGTPIEETLLALDDVVRSGKVRYIGHSNFTGWRIAQAEYVARELGTHRFISAQNHYSLLDRRAELEVTPAAKEFGLGVLPYFPLANGLLTGKYRRNSVPETGRLIGEKRHILENAPWEALEQYFAIADELGITPVELTFSWMAAQEVVGSVIAGATSPQQVVANANSIKPLGAEVLTKIDEIFPPAAKVALF